MASAMLKRAAMVNSMVFKGLQETSRRRAYASIAEGTDLVAAAPNVSLQKARTWDEGVASKFSTTPLKDIFKVPLCFFSFSYIWVFGRSNCWLLIVSLALMTLFLFSGEKSCRLWPTCKLIFIPSCCHDVCVFWMSGGRVSSGIMISRRFTFINHRPWLVIASTKKIKAFFQG